MTLILLFVSSSTSVSLIFSYTGVQVHILDLIIPNDLQTTEILLQTFDLLPDKASLTHKLEIKFDD